MKYLERSFTVATGFGPGQPGSQGRWVYDAKQQKLVRAEEYQPEQHALHAPIMLDRFYEGTQTVDGVDIGSRAKRRAYMKAKGLADFDDFSPGYYERQRAEQAREEKRERRETIIDNYKQYRETHR